MNQILETKNLKEIKKCLKKFKLQLFISLIFIILLTIYWLSFYYNKSKKEFFSNALLINFNIESLYYNKNSYSAQNEENNFLVIGIIEIPKINIKYTILSDTSDELLKISACRFYGPYPNKVGNLCIAAHNYDNNHFFSNLYQLNTGDIINIYDINNLLVTYSVYDKFETSKNDTSCTSQNTNGKREITLVTCNNFNKNRLIVKAKEILKIK